MNFRFCTKMYKNKSSQTPNLVCIFLHACSFSSSCFNIKVKLVDDMDCCLSVSGAYFLIYAFECLFTYN